LSPRLSWAIFGTILILAPQSAAAGDAPACALTRYAQIDMTTDDGGRVNIPLTIGNQTVHLLVDTGAVVSVLSRSTATALGLSPATSRMMIMMYGGQTSNQFVIADHVTFGNFATGRMGFFVMPDESFPTGVSGLIGPDIMRNYDVEFDFANSVLNVLSQNHCPNQVVYWTHGLYARLPFTLDNGAHIKLSVQLDGKEIDAGIDTGAQETVGSLEDILDDLNIDEKDPALKPFPKEAHRPQAMRYPFKTLAFDGIVVKNPDIVLYSNKITHMRRGFRELIVGMNVLRELHLYVAYGELALYVTPATAH
jgi:predicted aspartyl protease